MSIDNFVCIHCYKHPPPQVASVSDDLYPVIFCSKTHTYIYMAFINCHIISCLLMQVMEVIKDLRRGKVDAVVHNGNMFFLCSLSFCDSVIMQCQGCIFILKIGWEGGGGTTRKIFVLCPLWQRYLSNARGCVVYISQVGKGRGGLKMILLIMLMLYMHGVPSSTSSPVPVPPFFWCNPWM